jgi:hypothetical protein
MLFRETVCLLREPYVREREMGEVVRDTTTFRARKKKSIFPVLKVPRQCPLVLLVEEMHIIGIRFFYLLLYFIFLI